MDRFWRTFGGAQRVGRVAGVKNFRDVGGYPVLRGGRVKMGRVFRSASFAKATPEGFHTLKSLGIKTFFDLRSNVEISQDVAIHAIGEKGMKRVHCPVFSQEDFSPLALGIRWKFYTEGSDGFSKAYSKILQSAGPVFRTILLSIAGEPASDDSELNETPCVVHCTAGKDRTGVFVAVLLSFLGVEDDIIVRDYALTEALISFVDKC
ncbi:hypothetical protein HDU67_001071 [Dinochytrium kinnereticum]|nr:hypothetical protein HDU67_001071 [Dinochytrium kinnereticum]